MPRSSPPTLPALLLLPLLVAPALPAVPDAASPSRLLAELAFEGGTVLAPCPGAVATVEEAVVALPVPISYNHWGDFDPQGKLFVLLQDAPALLRQVAERLAQAGEGTAGATFRRTIENLTAAAEALDEVARLPPEPGALPAVQRAAAALAHVATAAPEDARAAADDLGAADPTGSDLAYDRLARFDVSPLAQPLVTRAHLGECVVYHLLNLLPDPVSLHVHAAATKAGQGSVLGAGLPDLAMPGSVRDYVVFLPDLPGMEGAHLLHSHADARSQTRHGLFGALVAEPAGARWLAPADRAPLRSGVEAIIDMPAPDADFREYVLLYHDEVDLLDHTLRAKPVVDDNGYGPGSKAINLRTEPFSDRFAYHDEAQRQGLVPRGHDKSQAYGSYAYGDPGTFIPKAYVGDPSKFRLVNAGPGQHHVHHLHGGGDRWRQSPVSDDTQFDQGLLKFNPVPRSPSDRIDVQSIGPGESFNAEIEGGAGGVQQAVGDFLFHCHIVEHYVGGMWSFWRVFDTLQAGLAELPDRRGRVPAAVDSLGLLGRTMPDGTVLTPERLPAWVEAQLPPPALEPVDDGDAATWDWTAEGPPGAPRYYGEPETNLSWPNHRSANPGVRPALQFNPLDGRLAYPLLAPHLGKRPPFAPGHGPAPHLGPTMDPGHPDGLCPAGAPQRDHRVVALGVPVHYNSRDVDMNGEVFVRAPQKQAVLDDPRQAQNLVLRANQGDCVDITLTSQLPEPEGERKVNMHIHLVQFDPQASDGVITGFHFEQSVRPATTTGTALREAARKDTLILDVEDSGALRPGTLVGVGLTEDHVEIRKVEAVLDAHRVQLDRALDADHNASERVGPEFVRYRWYADVELGMVYWHDHVDGLRSWRHGLFGGLVVEPAGSDWRDPKTGAKVLAGPVADIVLPGLGASFRELVLEFQDRSGCTGPDCAANAPPVRGQDLASFNLRASPLVDLDPTAPLSSAAGPPGLDPFLAFAGDPVTVRLLYAGQADSAGVATFGVTGHRFAAEANLEGSRLGSALSLGISAQHNLRLDCGAGSCGGLPGDYLFHMTQPDLLDRGAWGILRVLPPGPCAPWQDCPLALSEAPPAPRLDLAALRARAAAGDWDRDYSIVAVDLEPAAPPPLDLGAASGAGRTKAFVLAGQEPLPGQLPEPLVLRANAGDLVRVVLTNHLQEPVSLHASMLQALSVEDLGLPVGDNPAGTVAPGATRAYAWVADREVGAALLRSYGTLLAADGAAADQGLDGLYGALVVEPAGSTFEPAAGTTASLTLAAQPGRPARAVREHVLLYASDDPLFQASVMPYNVDVDGPALVNYRTAPLGDRLGAAPLPEDVLPFTSGPFVGGPGVHPCQVENENCGFDQPRLEARNPLGPFARTSAGFGDPATPLLQATLGEPLVVRALGAAGDALAVHTLAGHAWAREADLPGCRDAGPSCRSAMVDAATLGVGEASNAWIPAAGPAGPGDYLWGNHRGAFDEAGQWGLLRVQSRP